MTFVILAAATIGIGLIELFGRRLLLAGAVKRHLGQAMEPAGTASVLGSEETRTNCRILAASRRGMRIEVVGGFPADGQINVEWGNEFFVGTIRFSRFQGEQQILSLRVVSTNRR